MPEAIRIFPNPCDFEAIVVEGYEGTFYLRGEQNLVIVKGQPPWVRVRHRGFEGRPRPIAHLETAGFGPLHSQAPVIPEQERRVVGSSVAPDVFPEYWFVAYVVIRVLCMINLLECGITH